MPLHYQLYEDYINNKERLDILKAASSVQIPFLICHGTEDTGVPIESAHALHKANRDSELFIINSDHVFGRKHPWTAMVLPVVMQEVVDKNIGFFKKHLFV